MKIDTSFRKSRLNCSAWQFPLLQKSKGTRHNQTVLYVRSLRPRKIFDNITANTLLMELWYVNEFLFSFELSWLCGSCLIICLKEAFILFSVVWYLLFPHMEFRFYFISLFFHLGMAEVWCLIHTLTIRFNLQ